MPRPPIDWTTAQRQAVTVTLVTGLAYVALQAAYYFRDVLTVLVSAMLIAYVLQLAVDPLSRKMPRLVAVAVVVLTFGIAISVGVAFVVPVVFDQVRQLVVGIPGDVEHVRGALGVLQQSLGRHHIGLRVDDLDAWLSPRLATWSQQATDFLPTAVMGGMFGFFGTAMTVVCAFYFLKDGRAMWASLLNLLPTRRRRQMEYLALELHRSLHRYFRGQVINASVVLIAATVAFSALGMRYGIVGGLVWGILEVIPYFGTYAGLSSALLLASMQGGSTVGRVAIAGLCIWWTKDNIIAPRVMSHTTGLHPVVIVVAVLIGGKLAGILGVLLAIPVTAVLVGGIRFYLKQRLGPEAVRALEGPSEASAPAAAPLAPAQPILAEDLG